MNDTPGYDAIAHAIAGTAPPKHSAADSRNRVIKFLTTDGLYTKIDLSEWPLLRHFLTADALAFDMFCAGCKRETTFRVAGRSLPSRGIDGGRNSDKALSYDAFCVDALCQRAFHVISFVFRIDDDQVRKIGQYPSVADVAFAQLRTIDGGLDDIDRKELGQALGLFAHDAAIGAYVYLRRTFERIIERAHVERGGDLATLSSTRMDERIQSLKEVLPAPVIRNSALFSHLSEGIHSLTEDQCRRYFPVVKAILFQMLEEESHQRARRRAEEETERAFQAILAEPKRSSESSGEA